MQPFPALQSNVFLYIRNRELLLPWESVAGIKLTGLMQASVVGSGRGCGLMEMTEPQACEPERKGAFAAAAAAAAAGPAGHLRGERLARWGVGAQGQLRVNKAFVSMLLCVVFPSLNK